MKSSTNRILTTYAGSLPRPEDLVDMFRARQGGQPVSQGAFEARTRTAVAEVVRKQVECGIDIPCDGEYGKVTWNAYINERLAGFEPRVQRPGMTPQQAASRDRLDFPGFYAEWDKSNFSISDTWGRAMAGPAPLACTGPVTYTGQAEIQREVESGGTDTCRR